MSVFREIEDLLEIRGIIPIKKSTKKGKLLIIDDNEKIIQALVEVLKDHFELDRAYSSEEALKKLDDSFQLALLDIKMPGMDGIEAFHLFKQKYPELKIIFHSAYPGNHDNVSKLSILPHSGYFIKGEYSNKELIYSLNSLI